jgi:hypothetical protein
MPEMVIKSLPGPSLIAGKVSRPNSKPHVLSQAISDRYPCNSFWLTNQGKTISYM